MSHLYFFFFKQKTAYEMRISDWSSDVCPSDLKTSQRVEEIKIRVEKSVLDTVYYTLQGPVSYAKNQKPADFGMANNIPVDYALKWVAHLPSNELRTFYELNKAKDYEGYRKALVYFSAPAQNFVFADRQGDISITSNGLFPLKEK